MAQTSDADLPGRILALESAVRALQTTAASAGTLTSAADPSVHRIDGVLNASATTGWDASAGPTVDVLVPGGRMLIEWTVQHEVWGGTSTAIHRVGYQLSGPGLSAGYGLDGAPVLIAADPSRVSTFKDKGGTAVPDSLATASSFDVTPVLAPGWYRVALAYQLSYNASTTGVPFGIAANRVLAVTLL